MTQPDTEPGRGEPGRRQHIAVCLSGGGHRAALFGAGALLYLIDAGKGPELSCVSSVSGGSMTNAAAGIDHDLTSTTPAQFRDQLRPLVQACASGGTVWSAPLTIGYLAAGAVTLVAAAGAALVLPWGWKVLAVIGALLLLGLWARQRGWVAERAFDRALLGGRPLSRLSGSVDHVICAADFQTSESVYFSGRFVYSYRLGWGRPGELRLARAVQASASLPGAFHSRRLKVERFAFQRPSGVTSMLLTDGGVYDNMATQWPLGLGRRLAAGGAVIPPRSFDELIVVNSSAAKGVVRRRTLDVPLLGELTELLAVKDVLYAQTTAVRRRLLDLRFRTRRPGHEDPQLDGTIVQIDRWPGQLAWAFTSGADARAERAQAALSALAVVADQEWKDDARADADVVTQLLAVSPAVAARLMRHAYALTMANAHVLLDYPLREIPTLSELEAWANRAR